jgi:hypothetical protein
MRCETCGKESLTLIYSLTNLKHLNFHFCSENCLIEWLVKEKERKLDGMFRDVPILRS